MKKALILILALIIVFGAVSAFAESRIAASAEDLEFRVDSLYGDISSAEGLEICGFLSITREMLALDRCDTWLSDIKIENGQPKTVSVEYVHDANINPSLPDESWQDPEVSSDPVERQQPQIKDLEKNIVYKVYPKEGYYFADVTDAGSGKVLYTVEIEKCDGEHVFPKLFAGRGSVVIAIVEDKFIHSSKPDGWTATGHNIYCLTAEGKLFKVEEKNFDSGTLRFYLTEAYGAITATSVGERFAVVQRSYFSKATRNEAGEVVGEDFLANAQTIWIFGPSGLEYLGLLRCSLDDAIRCGEYDSGFGDYYRDIFHSNAIHRNYPKLHW